MRTPTPPTFDIGNTAIHSLFLSIIRSFSRLLPVLLILLAAPINNVHAQTALFIGKRVELSPSSEFIFYDLQTNTVRKRVDIGIYNSHAEWKLNSAKDKCYMANLTYLPGNITEYHVLEYDLSDPTNIPAPRDFTIPNTPNRFSYIFHVFLNNDETKLYLFGEIENTPEDIFDPHRFGAVEIDIATGAVTIYNLFEIPNYRHYPKMVHSASQKKFYFISNIDDIVKYPDRTNEEIINVIDYSTGTLSVAPSIPYHTLFDGVVPGQEAKNKSPHSLVLSQDGNKLYATNGQISSLEADTSIWMNIIGLVGKTASTDYVFDHTTKILEKTELESKNFSFSANNTVTITPSHFLISPDESKAVFHLKYSKGIGQINTKYILNVVQLDASGLPITHDFIQTHGTSYIGFHPTNNRLIYDWAALLIELDPNTLSYTEKISEWIPSFLPGGKLWPTPPDNTISTNIPASLPPDILDKLFILSQKLEPTFAVDGAPTSNGYLSLTETNQRTDEIYQRINLDGATQEEQLIFHHQTGSLYITDRSSSKVPVVDAFEFKIKETLLLPTNFGMISKYIGVNAKNTHLYFLKDSKLQRIPLNTGSPNVVPEVVKQDRFPNIQDAYINPQGNKLVILFNRWSSNNRLEIYDLDQDPFSTTSSATPITIPLPDRNQTTRYTVHGLLMDYYGDYLYVWGDDGKIKAYSSSDGSLVRGPLDIGKGVGPTSAYKICFSKDEQKLYFTKAQRKIVSIDAELTQVLEETQLGFDYEAFTRSGTDIHVSEDGHYLYLYPQSNSNRILAFDLRAQEVSYFISDQGEIESIAFPFYPPDRTPPAGATAYVTNNSHDDVSVIDVATDKEVAVIQLETGANPYGVAVSPDGQRAYIGNRGNNTVSVIQTTTNRKIHTITPGAQPLALAVSPAGTELFVTTFSGDDGKVEVYDRANYALLRTIDVEYNPDGIAVAPDGNAYVTNRTASGFIVSKIVAGASTVASTVGVGQNAEGIVISPDGTKAYVANGGGMGQVSVIDLASFTSLGDVTVEDFPEGISISPDGNTVYVANRDANSVSIVDATDLTASAVHVPVGTNPEGVSVSSDGSKVYIVNEGSDNISILNTATNTVTGTIPIGDSPEGFGQFITPLITSELILDLDPHAYVSNSDDDNVSVINTQINKKVASISVGDYPEGVAVHPDGSKIYVSNLNSNNLSVIEQSTGIVEATIAIGQKPLGICLNADGSKAYVANVGVPGGTSPSYTATNSTISVINTTNSTVSSTIPNIPNPYGVALNGDDSKLYVTNYYSGTVTVINTSDNSVATESPITVGQEPCGILYHKGLNKLYVANHKSNTVSVIDLSTATPSILTTITVGSEPIGLAFSKAGDLLYVTHENFADVEIIETATDTKSSNTLATTTFQRGISLTPGGKRVYVVDSNDKRVRVFDAETRVEETYIPVGNNPEAFGTFITAGKTKGFIPVIPTNTTTDRTGTIAVADLDQPFAEALLLVSDVPNFVQVSPDGSRAYIADNTGSDYQVIYALTNRSTNHDLSYIPSDLELSDDGNFLFISEKVNPNVNVLDAYTGRLIQSLSTDTNPLASLSSSPDGNTLCGASTTGDLVIIQRDPYSANTISTLGGTVEEIVFHPDGTRVFVKVAGVGIKVVDLTGTEQGLIDGITVTVFTLSPDGNTLYFTEASDNKLYKLDISTGPPYYITVTAALKQTVARVGNNTGCLEVSEDGKFVYVLDTDLDDLMVFDANQVNQLAPLQSVDLRGKPSGCGCFMRFPE